MMPSCRCGVKKKISVENSPRHPLSQVAVVNNGTAHFHKVTVARDFGTEVEVRDGIKPGDEVILKPAVTLADGSKVQSQEVPLQTSQR